MSDYSEHLISMAGGDGDPLDAITEAAAVALYALSDESESGTPFSERHYLARNRYLGRASSALKAADVPALLETVRTQQATLDRVLNLANTSGRCGWRISADELRKTLRGES